MAVFVLTIVSLITPFANLYLTVAGAFVSFSLAIISLFIITLSPVPMRGRAFSYTTLILSMIFLFLFGAGSTRCIPSSRMLCGTKLKGLGTSLMVYEYDFGKLPDINIWEDELIEKADAVDWQFICRESQTKGSSYAINKYVYDVPFDQWPEDLVVMFEAVPLSDGARNISGGPELINIANHDYLGMNMLFGNGTTRFVRAREIAMLNWSSSPDFVFPSETASYIQAFGKERREPAKVSGNLKIALLFAAALCGALAILLKRHTAAYMFISVAVAIVWGMRNSSVDNFRQAANFWFSLPVWMATCYVIHIVLKQLEPKYPEAFAKDMPVLVGLSVGTVAGMLWLIPSILLGPVDTERHLIGDTWLASIALSGLAGFWFGAFEGFVWKKLFVAKKSDPSDKSDKSE